MYNLGQYLEVSAPHNKCTAVKRAAFKYPEKHVEFGTELVSAFCRLGVASTKPSCQARVCSVGEQNVAKRGEKSRKEETFHLRDSLGPGLRGECVILHMRR